MSNRLRRFFVAIPLVAYKVSLVLALLGAASFDGGMTEDACDDVVELLKESVQPKPLGSNELNAGLRAGRAKLLLTDPLLMRMAGSYPLRHSNHSLPNGLQAPLRC